MSLFDSASLCITPNGVKEGKLYSIKPTDGSGNLSVTRATTATRVNSSGLIESVATNVPRLDYTNGSCPSILVEPQRTNLATFSEQFNDASWTKSSSTITANTSIAPTGNATADTLTITSGGYLLKQVLGYSAVSGQSITISIFAKNQTTDFLIFGGATAAGIDVYTIQDYGNGWYRHTRTRTFTTTATTTIQFAINQIGTHIIWGAQLEAGSYATSYIPTVASSVTRNADVISKTGISSLIGQTEGTFLLDVNLNSRAQFTYFALAGTLASSQNYLGIIFGSSIIGFESVVSTSLQAGINFSNSSTGRFKIAVSYKANNYYYYVNGNLIGSDTSGTVPSCNDISLAIYGNAASINYNNIVLWKTQLTNAELASLTSL